MDVPYGPKPKNPFRARRERLRCVQDMLDNLPAATDRLRRDGCSHRQDHGPQPEVTAPMISAPQPLTVRRVASKQLQCGLAAHGEQILVAMSRELMADQGQPMKGQLDARLEGAPA